MAISQPNQRIKTCYATALLLFIFSNLVNANNLSSSTAWSNWPNLEQINTINTAITQHPIQSPTQVHRLFLKKTTELLSDRQLFNSEQNYTQTTFFQDVKFFLTQFNKPALFTLDVFKKPISFSSVTSKEFMNFEWAIFNEYASFNYSNLLNQVNFYEVAFEKGASFYATKFDNANFIKTIFNGPAIFNYANFHGRALFVNAKFYRNVSFEQASFHDTTDFSYSTFYSNLLLTKASFQKTLSFANAQFHGLVVFDEVKLPEYLDFSNVTHINQPISFKKITPEYNKIIKINLVGTEVTKIILDYSFFSLYFPEEASPASIQNVYQSLLKVQQDNGFENGYKKLRIEFLTYQYRQNGQYISYFFDKYFWNFGFDKAHLIVLIGYIILFFTLINTAFFHILEREIYTIPFLNISSKSEIIEKHFIFRYLFYFPMALIYTLLVMFRGILGESHIISSIKGKNFFICLYFLLIMASGIFSTFLVLQFIIKS